MSVTCVQGVRAEILGLTLDDSQHVDSERRLSANGANGANTDRANEGDSEGGHSAVTATCTTMH